MLANLQKQFAVPGLVLGKLDAGYISVLCDIDQRVHATPWSYANFKSSLAQDTCIGVFDGDTLVGYCVVAPGAHECEVLLLSVDASYQRRGIARALLRSILDCHATEGQSFFLEVRQSNQQAQMLYDSLGFNEVGTRKDYYRLPSGKTEDALIYAYQAIDVY